MAGDPVTIALAIFLSLGVLIGIPIGVAIAPFVRRGER